MPVEETGYLAPVLIPGKCVGCGLCQARCHNINVLQKGLLSEAAVKVVAGPGKEDRIMRGSYRALREAERREQEARQERLLEQTDSENGYLPDFLK